LHLAAKKGSLITTQLLLEHKPSIIDDKDYVEKTALMTAAENGNAEVVKFLLSREAKITKDLDRRNCLDYAVDNDWPEVAIVIIDANPPVWKKVR
jgi:ankyrin repeat protein